MKKVLFIIGPTAVGKTALALKIAQGIPSVLISADSIQVYRGADIISGKDHPKDVKIELVNILEPSESFSVRDFVDRVSIINKKSEGEHRISIIVGGTGLYARSLLENIETINVPQDLKLRKKLGKLSVKDLQEKLEKLNTSRFIEMNNSDKNNPRRLIRAIEIAMEPSSSRRSQKKILFEREDILIVGLETSMEDLRERIKLRVQQRIKMGALDEAKKLFENYKKLSPQLKVANGYKEMFQFLQHKISWGQAVEQWETADYQHAKAQMTWFKKDKNVVWFDIGDKKFEEKIMKLVFLSFPRMTKSSF